MEAMILAAGLGTRLLPYTNYRPKPLFPVMGFPLLLSTINTLRICGFSPIIINTFHLHEQVEALLEAEKDIILQVEENILGTGGGIRHALKSFSDMPVLIVNGDICHNIDYLKTYQEHIESGADLSLVCHDFTRFNKVGIAADGNVLSFSADNVQHDGNHKKVAFTGIHIVKPQMLKSIPPDGFYNIIDHYENFMAEGGRIRAAQVENIFWSDIGTPDDYLALHKYLLENGKMLERLNRIAGSGFYRAGEVAIGANVKLEGWGILGDRAVIGAGAVLENVVVWDNAIVEEGAVCRNCIIC